jgi:hypothetical protein
MTDRSNRDIEDGERPPRWSRKRLTTGAAGTVILGLIGSALWEMALKPGMMATRNVLLDLTSLGIKSVQNATYQEVARGLHEHASNQLVSLLLFFALGMATGAMGYWRGRRSRPSREALEAMTVAELQERQTVLNRKLGRLETMLKFSSVAVLLMVAFLAGNQLRQSYALSAVGHFNQLSAILAPYIPVEESLLMRSQFSQIDTRADNLSLIGRMESKAKEVHARIPKFHPW